MFTIFRSKKAGYNSVVTESKSE